MNNKGKYVIPVIAPFRAGGLVFFILFCSLVSFSQNIAINATGNPAAADAGLDVSFTNKGFLPPRVSLANSTDLMGNASLTTGLFLYKNAGAWSVNNGFYYWKGASWKVFGRGAGVEWGLTGNENTTAGTNFVGTTDGIDFNLRANNRPRLHFFSSGRITVRDEIASCCPNPTNYAIVVQGDVGVEGSSGIGSYTSGSTRTGSSGCGYRLVCGGNIGYDTAQNAPAGSFFTKGDGTYNGGWAISGQFLGGCGATAINFYVAASSGGAARNFTDATIVNQERMRLTGSFGERCGGVPCYPAMYIGSIQIGVTTRYGNMPLNIISAASATTGAIMSLAGTTANQVEGGRIRMQETTADFQGGYAHYNASTNALHFGVHNTADQLTASDINAMTILRSTGFVGIRNINPQDQLDVTGNFRISTLAAAGTRNVTAASTGNLGALAAGAANNVLVGTGVYAAVPAYASTWAITGNAATNVATDFIGTTDAQPLIIKTSGAEVMRVTSGGDVGIGTTAPAEKLELCGNLKVFGDINASGLITGTVSITCSSDIRYKKDITPLSNALDNVMKLQGVNYFWKQEEYPEKNFTNTKQIGVIAQEVEKVYPELVFTDKDGFKSVDYSRFTPILIEAVKELNTKNEKLQASIDNSNSLFEKQQKINEEFAKRVELLKK